MLQNIDLSAEIVRCTLLLTLPTYHIPKMSIFVAGIIFFEKQMNRIKIFLDSVQVMLFKDRLEVWNPSKLPQGMTIAKLNKEHTSFKTYTSCKSH